MPLGETGCALTTRSPAALETEHKPEVTATFVAAGADDCGMLCERERVLLLWWKRKHGADHFGVA